MREVGQGRGELVALALDRRELGLHRLDLGREVPHPRDHLGGVAARALCGGDLVRGAVLLGAAALHLGQQLAAAGVELEQPIEVSGSTAARQRLAGGARVRSDRAQVEHRAGARGYWPSAAACCSSDWISLAFPGCGGRSTSEPEYSATNSATASASSPTRMFCGMIAPEKPPLRIA